MSEESRYLELTGRFQTRVLKMDEEHQQLVDIINKMYEIYQHQGPSEEILMVLDRLLDYGVRHFSDEEAYMTQIGMPDIEVHKKIHQNLINQVIRLREHLQNGQEGIGEDTFVFLQNWLMGHIVGVDIKDYGISEKQISELSDDQLQRLANSLEDYHSSSHS